MEEVLVIGNAKVVYEAHWTGMEDGRACYDRFDIGTHEVDCRHMPTAVQLDIRDSLRGVETAHSKPEEVG